MVSFSVVCREGSGLAMKELWATFALLLVVGAANGLPSTCEDRPNFSFVKDSEYCYRYYICIYGSPYPMRCSGELWFDEETQSCRSPSVVTCEVDGEISTPAPIPGICDDAGNGELVLHPYFCNTYYICSGQIGVPVVCPTGMWFDAERQMCADPLDASCPHGPGAAKCQVEEDFALVPSEEYCYRYYQCLSGFPYPMVCPDNQWFDPIRDVCDDRANVECILEPGEPTVPPTPYICYNTVDNRLTPNPTACNKYYICVNQIGWSRICPLNMWFDEEGQTCVPAGTVDCPLGPPIPPETTTTPFSRCDDVPNLQFVASYDNCYEYYQCRNGNPYPLTCPRDQLFSEEMQRCVDQDAFECEIEHLPPPVTPTPGICTDVADGVLVLHPQYCNRYYLCVNQVGIATTCPLGQWFNELSQTCSNALNVDCPHGPTTPPPDPFAICDGVFDYRFVKNEHYCYRYFQCIGGTPYPLVCHDGMWFDEVRQRCDRSEYVECDALPPPDVRPPDVDGICNDVQDGHLAPHHTFCNEFFLCVREVGWPLICPLGLWFDEAEQTCSIGGTVPCDLGPERPAVTESPYAMCTGIPNMAYVRDPDYCYRYFKCVSGSPFPMICPNEQWFDERQQRCRDSSEVECVIEDESPRPPPTAGVCNGVSNGIQVPNPRACNQFYVCANDVGFSQVCGFGLWFDEDQQACLPPGEAYCDLGPPTTTTIAPHPWALCDDVPNYSYVPSPNYCYRFFQCIDGAPFPMICRGNLWFDSVSQTCMDPEEVTCLVSPNPPVVPPTPGICIGVADGRQVLNPRACNQFYVCVDGVGYSLVCPDNMWFDEFHQVCQTPSQTYCPLAPQVTTPSPYERCAGEEDNRLLRNDFYCYRYYQCVDEVAYPMICRPGRWFDLERQVCDVTQNVVCELRPGNPGPIISTPGICEGVADGRFERNWNYCNQYYLCVDGEGYGQICPDGLWFDEPRQICDLSENVYCPLGASTPAPTTETRCYGREDLSRFENDDYCYRFFQCKNGVPYPMICSGELWFAEDRQQCVPQTEVECEGADRIPDVPPTEGICTGVANGRQVSHPLFCNQFYVCIEQVGFPQICPFGLWFDVDHQSCVAPDLVECPHGLRPTPSPIEGICYGAASGTKVPNPEDCTWFYICIQEQPYASPCAEGMAFDKVLLTCVPEADAECADTVTTLPTPGVCHGIDDFTLVRSPYDCAAYYVCLEGHAQPGFCPLGQYFDEALQRCELEQYVECWIEIPIRSV
ncbi:uncharacterized protein LOC109421758 isoform X2 [Aedes albopictus]|uniref:Chitin-binding type-2 domain-containing protein n=1 Tax=Aedes albopictus TaxID=7160 RepID=A0ABM1Z3Q9_AEDAL